MNVQRLSSRPERWPFSDGRSVFRPQNDSRASAGLLKDHQKCNLKPNLRFPKVALYFGGNLTSSSVGVTSEHRPTLRRSFKCLGPNLNKMQDD